MCGEPMVDKRLSHQGETHEIARSWSCHHWLETMELSYTWIA
jgi:hypothetical protein